MESQPTSTQRFVAEFIGTFGLVFAGCGAIIVDQVSNHALGKVGIGIVFGLIVMAMIYALGHISGAHINPAVTLALAAVRRFPIGDIALYWAAQLTGALSAALVLLATFGNVADLGATTPSRSSLQSLALETALTFFLMLVIMAVATDERAQRATAAIAIGATVGLEAIWAGPISGASMNPARSLGPALISGDLGAIWVYIIGPIVGAAAAALLYAFVLAGRSSISRPPSEHAPIE